MLVLASSRMVRWWTGCHWLLLTATSILFLASLGCKVGPDYAPPASPPMDETYLESRDLDGSAPLPHSYWWVTFEDPVLDDMMAYALSQNLDIREAAWRIAEARSQRRVVRGELLPQVFGNASYDYRRISANANQFVSSTPLLQGFDFYSAGFDATWEIDLFGKLRRGLEASDADIGERSERYAAVRVSLTGEIGANYVNLRVLQERIRFAEENLKVQQRTLRIVDDRIKAGLAGPLDRAQAATVMHNTASLLPPLREQQRITQNRLAVLLGTSPAMAAEFSRGPRSIPQPASLFGAGVPADLLRHRPDIRAAERDVAAAAARIGVATADLYPQLTLTGSINVDTRMANNWFTPASIAHAVGPQFSWNILNFGRIRGNIAVQEARLQQAIARFQQRVLQGVVEVENSLTGYHEARQRVIHLTRAVESAEDALRISRMQYDRGITPFVNVLDAQRQLLIAQDQLVQARGRVIVNLIKLYKALGGGAVEPQSAPLPAGRPDAVEELQAPQVDEFTER